MSSLPHVSFTPLSLFDPARQNRVGDPLVVHILSVKLEQEYSVNGLVEEALRSGLVPSAAEESQL